MFKPKCAIALAWSAEGMKKGFDVGKMEYREDHDSMPKRAGAKVL